jgi:hypothetical protein
MLQQASTSTTKTTVINKQTNKQTILMQTINDGVMNNTGNQIDMKRTIANDIKTLNKTFNNGNNNSRGERSTYANTM